MKKYVYAFFVSVSLSCCYAIQTPVVIDNKAFISSVICRKYSCTLDYANKATNFYIYKVVDPKNKEIYMTNIWNSKYFKNNLRIDLKQGTLDFVPSLEALTYFREVVKWATGVELRMNNELGGSPDFVPADSVAVSALARGTIGVIPVTIYVRSVPDPSLDPKRGNLAYGIVDSSWFPKGLLK